VKTLLTILCVLAIASVAWADKPAQTIGNPIDRVECAFENITHSWDFEEGDGGFTTGACDDGGVPVWAYDYWSVADAYCWGTSHETGEYPIDAGDSLISPSWVVDESSYLVEIQHVYDIEPSYDGGNLSVNGVVVEPMGGYPDDVISDSETFYAWCVDGEPGWTGYYGEGLQDCFDLSAFMGEEVQLSFDFGSDSSVTYPGWAIFGVFVGGDVVANDGTTWSAVKGMYR